MMSDLQLLTGSICDLEWLKENIQDIKKKYEGEIIAIKDKEVVGFAPSTNILFKRLKDKNIDQTEVIIEYISPENEILIL